MYHLCESIGTEPLILKEIEWHQLDNIASICGLVLNLIFQDGIVQLLDADRQKYSKTLIMEQFYHCSHNLRIPRLECMGYCRPDCSKWGNICHQINILPQKESTFE